MSENNTGSVEELYKTAVLIGDLQGSPYLFVLFDSGAEDECAQATEQFRKTYGYLPQIAEVGEMLGFYIPREIMGLDGQPRIPSDELDYLTARADSGEILRVAAESQQQFQQDFAEAIGKIEARYVGNYKHALHQLCRKIVVLADIDKPGKTPTSLLVFPKDAVNEANSAASLLMELYGKTVCGGQIWSFDGYPGFWMKPTYLSPQTNKQEPIPELQKLHRLAEEGKLVTTSAQDDDTFFARLEIALKRHENNGQDIFLN